MSMSTLWGWMGKLPCAGDFLSHGLPCETAAQLDHWISQNLVWLNENKPGWPQLYFKSPARGFVIEQGCTLHTQESARVIGILMPSVDSVGRPYPFILLQGIPASPLLESLSFDRQIQAIWTACANALELNWTTKKLEIALEEIHKTDGKDSILGSWNELTLNKGPDSWFSVIPQSNQKLIVMPQPDLVGWPQGDFFLELFSPMRQKA